MTAFGSKSTIPPVSVVVIVFMAVITAALLHPAAATTQDDSKKSLTSALILGEESLLWLLMDTWSSGGSRRPPADKELEAVSTLLTLFDLQEELAAEAASTQDDQSALASMQTLLTKVINDSCDYINMTLHDSFTTDDVVDCTYGPDIHFMRQTFDCTREAAKELQTRLELLITIRETEDQVLSLPEFSRVIPEYEAWIGSFKSLKDSDRQYLECVSEYM